MRCLIVGCGSIGRRRGRILAEMGHEVYGYDTDPLAMRQWGHDLALGAWTEGPVFVCSPAATHVETAREWIRRGAPALFVEKPLSLSVDGIPELIAEAGSRGVVTMGACNMRWAYGIDGGTFVPGTPMFTVAKPLSQWRPGAEEAYRANGIALEMAIHEMDCAAALLGPVVDMWCVGFEDAVDIGLTHESGARSRVNAGWSEDAPTMRFLHYAGERARIEPDTSDAMYRAEMQHFLDCVKAGRETCNPLANAAHVLGWAIKAQEQIRAGVMA